MAGIDWPSGLMKGLVGTLGDGLIPAFVDDNVQVGAPRRRARFTRTLETWHFVLVLTDAQKATLKTFVKTTINGGVTEFNWTHPTDLTTHEVRLDPKLFTIDQSTINAWRANIVLNEI